MKTKDSVLKMSDLKTLKDIQLTWYINELNTEEHIKEVLKSEVIKWIKELRKSVINLSNPKGNEFLLKLGVPQEEYVIIVDWIKHFFNITEEDLEEWVVAPHVHHDDYAYATTKGLI